MAAFWMQVRRPGEVEENQEIVVNPGQSAADVATSGEIRADGLAIVLPLGFSEWQQSRYIAPKAENPSLTEDISRHMMDVYESDIFEASEDSLEGVMGQIYTDTFNRALENAASETFRSLLRLFTWQDRRCRQKVESDLATTLRGWRRRQEPGWSSSMSTR
jgi:hypothetical protein